MSLRLPRHLPRYSALALLPFFAGCAPAPQNAEAQNARAPIAQTLVANADENYPELRVGGKGNAPGQFADLRDFAFAPDGTIWTLEGPGKRRGDGFVAGNNRVQHLSADGQPLGQFSLQGEGSPFRIAADEQGTVYVTYWDENRVAAYNSQGQLSKTWNIPFALGLAPYQGGMAVTSGSQREGADKVIVIQGANSRAVKLSQSLTRVRDLKVDQQGQFWILAWTNQVYEFDAQGQLLQTIGAGTNARKGDGSEWFEAIALKSDGTLVGMDAGKIVRRAPDGALALRPDSIGANATYNRLQTVRVDNNNRVWVADFNMPQGNQPDASRPIIARLASDAFEAKAPGTQTVSAAAAGVNPTLTSTLAGNIAYDLKPFPLALKLPAASRNTRAARVSWVARDANKNAVDKGEFALDLNGNAAAAQSFSWTPPRFGWYQITATISSGSEVLNRAVALCGVTPPFANLPRFDQVAGLDRRVDVPRQMFAGMPAIRLDATGEDWLAINEKAVPLARQEGANVWIQFVEAKDVRPEWVGKVATQFKGRVRYYEFINEPDLKMKPADYLNLIRPAVAALRRADPAARVLGPATVQIRLDWMKQILEQGGGDLFDEWSFHPYEGHESTDPHYLAAKLTAMRALLARYGKANIPLWQGEHAIAAQRASVVWPNTQAERWVSDRDVFEQFGIPVERDMHFYLNPRGYGKVPSYAWTYQGPMALSLVARARYAMTRDRPFAGKLDFGRNGNGLFTGLRFEGAGETVVSLRANNVEGGGRLGLSADFSVNARSLRVTDAWGNERNVGVANNRVTLALDGLPLYVRLPRGVNFAPVALDWGTNIARLAGFSDTPGAKNVAALNDGLLQSIHYYEPGYNLPPSDTGAGKIFRAQMAPKGQDNIKPAVVTARWNAPQNVRTVLLKGIRADNQHCALLDYDIEAEINGRWQTITSVQTPVPPSELGGAMDTPLTSWSRDIADHIVQLPAPVSASAIRLTARRATRGLIPDQFAIETRRGIEDWEEPMSLDLSEIEIYG